MSWMSSLDAKDRRLLFGCVGALLVLGVLTAIFLPDDNNNENTLPSSYLSGRHGALAAYELLGRSGYNVERWERPLGQLAAQAGPGTVVIFAQPFTRELSDMAAVKQILNKGGRVIATGYLGGYLLPGNAVMPASGFGFAACQLEAEGLDPLASSGDVWMSPDSMWQRGDPGDRVQYSCAGRAAAVEYPYNDGHAVWWANSTPLENGSLERGHNLDFFLNSLGAREGHHFYWDESLHGEIRSDWSYASGPALTLLWTGVLGLAVLAIFSFSRRSAQVRELAAPMRTSPVEFVEALGSLYRKAGASSTAVTIAWERFRQRALKLCGMRAQGMRADELAAILRRRFPQADAALEADLAACQAAAADEAIAPREALRMVQLLARHMDELLATAKPAHDSKGVL